MFFNKPKAKPVKKSGCQKLDKKVSSALTASKGKCVQCKKGTRAGEALFCKKCLKNMWNF